MTLDNNDMHVYRGTKELKAWPMPKDEYCEYRSWDVPSDEDPNEAGYLVEYFDGGKANDIRHSGYISWSPKDVFERTYYRTDTAQSAENASAESAEIDYRDRQRRLAAMNYATQIIGHSTPMAAIEAAIEAAKEIERYLEGPPAETPIGASIA